MASASAAAAIWTAAILGGAVGAGCGDSAETGATTGAGASAGAGGSAQGGQGATGIGGSGAFTVVPDFALTDVNTSSATAGQAVSPRDYLGQVSAWYFGHAT